MDDERLKNPPVGSSVLERIRDIHASMRRVSDRGTPLGYAGFCQ